MKIKDFSEILNGYAFKSSQYINNGYRVIRITNVQSGYLEDKKPVFYEYNNNLNKYELKENDILISLTGNVGRCALITQEFLPAYLNQRVCCLRVNKEKVLPKFLYYILNSKRFEHECINSSKGIAQLNMSTEWLKEYNLEIPSIECQKKIIEIFDKLYTTINIKKIQLNKFEGLIKSQFDVVFKNETNKKKIKEISSYFSRGKSPNYVESSKIKVINQACIYWNDFKLENVKYQDENKISKAFDKLIKYDDVLITSTGTGTLGRVNVFRETGNNYMADGHVSILRLLPNKVNSVYFKYYFMQDKVQKKLYSNCVNGSTNQIELSKDKFKNFNIIVPNINLQNEFAEFVKHIDKQKFEFEKSLKKLEELQSALMREYFG